MSAISNIDIARAMHATISDKSSGHVHEAHKKIINFLRKRRLMPKVPAILAQLEKLINSEQGVVLAKVLSAHRLSDEREKELVHFLKKRYSGKVVALTKTLDHKLLGGMRVEVGDEVIDLTIRNKMRKLEEYLTRDHA